MASFTDVPTNAQFFAEIEAMKESGITAGCTATTFCPDANVTRRQMAAFFARALGLYWQY
jgi:S-layer homology domain